MIDREQIAREIAQRVGIPEALLGGADAREILDNARAILDYTGRGNEPTSYIKSQTRNLSTREQFANWMNGETTTTASEELDIIAESLNLYPDVRDGGEIDISDYGNSTRDSFAEWFNEGVGYANADLFFKL